MTDGLLVAATSQDVEAILLLTRQAYLKWVAVIGREPRPMTADYAEAIKNHRIDLLRIDGRLAALIEMIDEADCLLIENVAVAPAHQGKGLGRQLMAHAEQVASRLGYRRIRLYTNQKFAENLALYQRLGYSVDRDEIWDGGIIVHMSKMIDPAATATTC